MAPTVQKRLRCAKKTDDEPDYESNDERRMLATGTLLREENGTGGIAIGIPSELRSEDEHYQQYHHDSGHDPSQRFWRWPTATKAKSHSQEYDTYANTDHQTQNAKDSIPIASTEAQVGTPGTAQEHQRAEDSKHAQ